MFREIEQKFEFIVLGFWGGRERDVQDGRGIFCENSKGDVGDCPIMYMIDKILMYMFYNTIITVHGNYLLLLVNAKGIIQLYSYCVSLENNQIYRMNP